MVLVSYSGKEINAKIVFYGPGLSGKTSNLEYIYGSIPSNHRGKMVSMKTKTERTLFFDFLPLNLGELAGFKTRFLLYTVPGQVYYNATRKLVLKGVDAVVFVADSQRGKMDENIESFRNLKENLKENGLSLDEIPYVLQYNKRDLPDLYSVDEMDRVLNTDGVPTFEAVATTGAGIFETFKAVSKLLLAKLSKEIGAAVVGHGGGTTAASRATVSPAGRPKSTAPPAEVIHAETRPQPVAKSAPGDGPPLKVPAKLAKPTEPDASAGDVTPEPSEAPASEMTEALAERKSRGLWRWFRKDDARTETGAPPAPAAAAPPARGEEAVVTSPEAAPVPPSPPKEALSPVAKVAPPCPEPAAVAEEPNPAVAEEIALSSTAPTAEAPASAWQTGPPLPAEDQRELPASQDTGDGEEIVVPVLIPRQALRDRMVIRLVLRVGQEADATDGKTSGGEQAGKVA